MTQKILLSIHKIALGLLPLGLCFWYYRVLVSHPIEKIYFAYSDGLLFVSDALALLAVLAWAAQRFLCSAYIRSAHGPSTTPRKKRTAPLWAWLADSKKLGLAFCALASLSILWSGDWRVSLFVSLHLWLVFGVFLSVRDQPESGRAIAIGFCAALMVQIMIGFWQFGAQTTVFLAPLGTEWPGQIEPSMRGASIVELPDGVRWLRVYGSLPHPNMLGGFTLMFLAGPASFLLFSKKRHPWAPPLLAGGAALLILTFSRSAWLGLAAAGLVLMLQWRKLPGKRLLATGLAVLTGLLSAAAPLYRLIFVRAGAGAAPTEEFSNAGRIWLTQEALNIIQDHPLLGVGVGNFILEYARRAPYGYLLEPVHSLPLLLIAELGLAGAVIGVSLGLYILRCALRATNPKSILFSALLMGLLVTSFLDHYWWTLAPGRMLMGLALGLWAQNQETNHATDPL